MQGAECKMHNLECGTTELSSRDQPTANEPTTKKKPDRRGEFERWLGEVSPANLKWHWVYQRYIYKKLAEIDKGKCRRMMVFMPPRHGKSELITIRYTAWRLLNDPGLNVILGSYNQKLADKFSRYVKKIVRTSALPNCHAERLCLSAGDPQKSGGCASDGGIAPDQFSETDGKAQPFRSAKGQSQKKGLLNTASEWETSGGGVVRSVGVGGGIAGFGAGLIVIDDPVKNRAEAESATYRQRVWEWFNDDIYTRMEPNAAIILIQTRWHEDDLAGRLLNEMKDGGEQWEVVSLPALAEGDTGSLKGTKTIAQGKAAGCNPGNQDKHHSDLEGVEQTGEDVAPLQGAKTHGSFPGVTLAPLTHPRLLSLSPSATGKKKADNEWRDVIGRKPGQALCHDLFPVKTLLKYQKKLGTYSFSALYQQRPAPAEGGQFKREWFKNIVDRAPNGLRWKRGYDLAISTKTSADYTASFRCAYDNSGNLYIADGYRARIEYPDQRRYIVARMNDERDTEHGIESAMHGKAVVQELRTDRSVRTHAFKEVQVASDKLTRALAWLNLAEAGKLFLVRGPWIDEFVDEIVRFPAGRHDDQIDAVSVAVQMLGEFRRRYRAMGF